MRSWPLGYPTRSDTLRGLSAFKKTSLAATLIVVASIYLAVFLGAAIGDLCYLKCPPLLWIPINLAVLLVIARSQRALECLTHEASHYNWSRNTKLNDLLANILSAIPVFSTVESFKMGHLIHHNNFGMPNDPDKKRYSILRIEDIGRQSLGHFVKGVLSRLPAYAVGWYKNIGVSLFIVLLAIVWHLAVLVLPLAALVGVTRALSIWAIYWLAPMTAILPIIRFIGESDEHTYELGAESLGAREQRGAGTVFDATITSCGRLHALVFHPVNDGYHLTHHLYPTIPYRQLKKAHHYLIKSDPVRYGSRQRYRTRVLQNPTQNKPALNETDRSQKAQSAAGSSL